MSETILYIAYYIAQPQRAEHRRLKEDPREAVGSYGQQQTAVNEFLAAHGQNANIIESFVETPEHRRTAKWPQLVQAIEACQNTNATLLIAELSNLTNNEFFAEILLHSQVRFYCCDQPFVNQTVMEALCKHAQVQRKLHGKLIREGLKMTSAKSGNPNAAEVIGKVNKPKIDTAIVFAFLLQPIIKDYRRKGYPQRQMVKTLNEEGFTAPEGGRWVLSQLQKVLDRVRLNEVATELQPVLLDYQKAGLTPSAIAEALNDKKVPSLKRTAWEEGQVKKLLDRVEQIQEIIVMNRFVLDLLPLLRHYNHIGLEEQAIIEALYHADLPIRQDLGSPLAA